MRIAAALAAGWIFATCGSDSTGPSGKTTAKVTDPTGDTYGTVGRTQWDITVFTMPRDSGGIDLSLDFSANVISPVTGDTNAIVGQVDFDVDQDTLTGVGSVVDAFRPGAGSTKMGVDYALDLFKYVDSTVNILDSLGAPTGSVRPVFSGKRLSVRIPRSLLGGDEAFLNAAAIIGTNFEPTDIAPENGHLKVGGTGPVAPYRPSVSAVRPAVRPTMQGQRTWGRH